MKIAVANITARVRFLLNRVQERLWVKPLLFSVLSIAAVFGARLADHTGLARVVPQISKESVDTLLSVMASGMLVMATFAVGSMVAAYASASNTASPRSFPLVIADDSSQKALSAFVGAFIFSIVALVAITEGYYGKAGLFMLFSLTITVFGMVIFAFVRWVDRIARLGRMGNTIDKVEKATTEALVRCEKASASHAAAFDLTRVTGHEVFSDSVGYVQRIDVAELHAWAEEAETRIFVMVQPGSFVTPQRLMAYIDRTHPVVSDEDCREISGAFQIGRERTFDEDPRFGLIVLSQIAGRALSPAVNDPGTAIDIIGILVRLFLLWHPSEEQRKNSDVIYDRVAIPSLSVQDMFDDAFTAISLDGSGSVEVMIRLQKALKTLAAAGDNSMYNAAVLHSKRALFCAEKKLVFPEDLADVRKIAEAFLPPGSP
ncbi:MAG: DUF2254 domain-containing protein [Desulfotignum sp.]|nr:DUF2254 domain-containing protein [Desulfobacteraceae bacterium]